MHMSSRREAERWVENKGQGMTGKGRNRIKDRMARIENEQDVKRERGRTTEKEEKKVKEGKWGR